MVLYLRIVDEDLCIDLLPNTVINKSGFDRGYRHHAIYMNCLNM